MKPTRVSLLVLLALVAAGLGRLLASTAYDALPRVSVTTVGTLVALAVAELIIAKVVHDRLTGKTHTMHPLQIARAAVLAKASSPTGAVLMGGYLGFFSWVLGQRGDVVSFRHDRLFSGLAAGGALLLVVAALVLERVCRAPEDPDERKRSGLASSS